MGSMITRAKRLRIYRFIAQAVALVALNLRFLNIWLPNLALTGLQGVCAPGFYCHGCAWSTMACPLGAFVVYGRLGVFPFLALSTTALVGVLGGRFVCGWVCPFGWLQDMLFKIRTKKFKLPRQLNYVKYAVLVIFVFAIPYLFPHTRASFCDFCPSGFLETITPAALLDHFRPDPNDPNTYWGGLTIRFYIKLSITSAVLLLSVVVSRGFCRTLCPLGAIFGLFNKFSVFRYGLTFHKCNSCGACAKVCPVEIDPMKEMNDAECIRCYECTTTKHIKMGTK